MSETKQEGERSTLVDALREGLGSTEEKLRAELGVDASIDDAELAKRLVRELAAWGRSDLSKRKSRRRDPRPSAEVLPVRGADASLLSRLGKVEQGALGVDDVAHSQTLAAVARAGNLGQRRAAVRRLAQLVRERKLKGDDLRKTADFLSSVRDDELAYELSEARADLPGAVGKEVRDDRAQFDALATAITAEIPRFWEGQRGDEPVSSLPGVERAMLLMRVRDLGDMVTSHLGALVEAAEDLAGPGSRLELIGSLRYCGDRRLVASFVTVLESDDTVLAAEAARALARVDDPRVHPALRRAFTRSIDDRLRIVLAGALGSVGDLTGADYVRERLALDDPEIARLGLEAIATLGSAEDVELVLKFVDQGDRDMRLLAFRALGRIGDSRALAVLKKKRDETQVSALFGELEEAEAIIRARLELRGEVAEESAPLAVAETALEPILAPLGVRIRGWIDYSLGWFWLVLGWRDRAVRRFETAALRRPAWVLPVLSTAMVHARQDRHALALASFRRAIEVDRARVEGRSISMRALSTCFLRRAEEMEREGRAEIARGLLEEVLSLDLRRSPAAIRFEIARRHAAIRRRTT
jgi:tetratricopeptide (TPR) repeat protein